MRTPFSKSARFVVAPARTVLADRLYSEGELLPRGQFEWRTLQGLWLQRLIDVAPDEIERNEPDLPGEVEEDADDAASENGIAAPDTRATAAVATRRPRNRAA
jgi:hypothetical protein